MLLQLNKTAGDDAQFRGNSRTALCTLQHVIADRLHLAVFEGSGKNATLALNGPFADRLIDQKMKQRVVSRGDGASEASLLRICGFLLSKIICRSEERRV